MELLYKLSNSKARGSNKFLIHEIISTPYVSREVNALGEIYKDAHANSWMGIIAKYIAIEEY